MTKTFGMMEVHDLWSSGANDTLYFTAEEACMAEGIAPYIVVNEPIDDTEPIAAPAFG